MAIFKCQYLFSNAYTALNLPNVGESHEKNQKLSLF